MNPLSDGHEIMRLLVNNDHGALSRIIIEPWADEIDVQDGDQVLLVASGPGDAA